MLQKVIWISAILVLIKNDDFSLWLEGNSLHQILLESRGLQTKQITRLHEKNIISGTTKKFVHIIPDSKYPLLNKVRPSLRPNEKQGAPRLIFPA